MKWSSRRHFYGDIEGMRLHWTEIGEEGAEVPVLLLHGLNDSHTAWKKVAPALAKRRRVLMLDLPGHGWSSRPDASYRLDWHADMVGIWLDSIGVSEVDVAGHSFGGGVAQTILLNQPGRIRRLTLAAPGGLGREVGLILRLATLPHVVERFGQPFMAAGARLVLRAERKAFSKQDLEEVIAMAAAPGSARAFARTVRDVIGWRGQHRMFFQRAHEIRQLPPTTVCWGDRDTLIPIRHGRMLAELVEGVRLVEFTGCGHHLHREEPQRFSEVAQACFDDPTPTMPRFVPELLEVTPTMIQQILQGLGKKS